ncbi:penicillin-binding protein PBP2B [Streptococcus dentapri]|uniref:Penicillin-binding protein PBP2B n=1 Tax=Streptococcus dentapri TaxID=573564 RepID=A0ABV8D1C4_9STRE
MRLRELLPKLSKKERVLPKKKKKTLTRKAKKTGFLSSITSRLYIIFALVLMLLAVLIGRLAYMQVSNKDFYLSKLNKQTTYTVRQSSERGQIYDATGQPLVDNEKKTVVTYTRSNKVTAEDIRSVAKELSTMVDLTETKVSKREKKDYYLADPDNYKAIVDKLPDKKKYDSYGNSLTESDIYKNAVDAVPNSKIDYSEDELKQVYIFSQMNAASNFSTVYLTTGDLTEDQIAYITANKSDLHGISIGSDWNQHVTTSSSSLSDIIGTLSSEKTGLPQESADEYLAKGYSLNDRVGTSYLQKQYEDDLQGTRTTTKINVDNDGNVVSHKTTARGSKGNNLKLTIDLNFQNGVEGILNQYYSQEIASGSAANSEGVYTVALNADTGAVLAMAGLAHEKGTGETSSNALGTATNVFVPGSVVKGATLTAGWESGVISGNQTLVDQSINVDGSNPITSWFTGNGTRSITATQALEYSSNTYMVQVALKMMGQDYYPGMTLSDENVDSTMTALRATYAEYGMGTTTGIDLPNESAGYTSDDYKPGNVLTEAFGQYDSYTPLQLAQYAATVANGGSRIAPHLVSGIYGNNEDGGLGELTRSVDTQVLNKVNISDEQMGLIQQGFHDVVNSSDAYATGKSMASSSINISGKTGTAETFSTDDNGNSTATVNLNVVAYATANDGTRVAVAVMYPHAASSDSKAHQYIARDILNLYQSMYGGNQG